MSEEKMLSLKERLAAKAAARTVETPSLNERVAEAGKTGLPAAINPPEAALPAAPVQAPKKAVGRPKAVKETAPAATEAPTGPRPDKFALFLDCTPINEPNVANFELIIVQAHKRILEKLGKAHYTFISFEGDGVLSGTVAELLDEYKPSIVVVTNSSTREAGVCRSVLYERASAIIVSTR
jgi:hypothetical protein